MSDSTKDQSVDLFSSLAEVGIDQLLNNGILKDIPILGTAVQTARLASSVRDALFLRKVVEFLKKLEELTSTESEGIDLKSRIEHLAVNERRFGEAVVLLIDRMNDLEKPAILAGLVRAVANGRIDFVQFRRLSIAVDIAFVEDLRALARYKGAAHEAAPQYLDMLTSSGLSELSSHGVSVVSGFGSSSVYHPTLISELGRLFVAAME